MFFDYTDEIVDQEFIESFCQYLRMAQDYLETRGIPFLYCLNPAKTTVYARYLSDGYTYENKFNTAMLEALERYGVNYIENVSLLTEKSMDEQVYNVKYDAGHWNDLGCYYGTNHTLLSQVTYLTDAYFDLQLNPSYRNFVYAVYSDSTLPDVLFFHGSYYNGERTKFYQTSFHESIGIHNYENFLDLDYYVNIFEPDMVLLETAEYATTRGYFSIETLNSKILNPLYETVQELPHQSYALMELDPLIFSEEGSALTRAEFVVDLDIQYGYVLIDDKTFDLQIADGVASFTLKTENFSDTAQIELFTTRE